MKERIELANNPSAQKGNVEFDAAEREHKTILENLASKKNEHEAAKEHAQSVQLKEQNLKQELETVTAKYQELYNSKYYKEQELYNEQVGESIKNFLSRKVVCVFPMVIISILPHAEFGPNDHREDEPHFNTCQKRVENLPITEKTSVFDGDSNVPPVFIV